MSSVGSLKTVIRVGTRYWRDGEFETRVLTSARLCTPRFNSVRPRHRYEIRLFGGIITLCGAGIVVTERQPDQSSLGFRRVGFFAPGMCKTWILNREY